MSILCTRAPSDCLTSACFWVSSLVTCYLDYLHSVHTTTGNLFPTLRGVNLITTGLLLCKTAICLISGHLSPMGMALDKQCDPLQFFKCWHIHIWHVHVTKTKKGLKVTKYARYCWHGSARSEPMFFTMLRMDFSILCIFWELLHHKGSVWHIFLNSFKFV